jgi:hypothetical protein
MEKPRSFFTALVCSCALLALPSLPAGAEPTDPGPPTVFDNPYCGSVQNGVWMSNGNCGPASSPRAESVARVSGTITSVRGHLVTLQQSERSIVVNDQPALEMRTTGRVAVGRQIEATGYWRTGTFYATSLV